MDTAKPNSSDVNEIRIRAAWIAGEFRGAASLILESYGSEIFGFLIARLGNRAQSEEVFSIFSEDLCRGLPQFQWRCTARVYGYCLARNAANWYMRARRRSRLCLPDRGSSLDPASPEARDSTRPWLRTEVKERVRSLRENLSADDQAILILHVDRAMNWQDLAKVLHRKGELLEDAELRREAARLRKRFERIKNSLRTLAARAGLLDRER